MALSGGRAQRSPVPLVELLQEAPTCTATSHRVAHAEMLGRAPTPSPEPGVTTAAHSSVQPRMLKYAPRHTRYLA